MRYFEHEAESMPLADAELAVVAATRNLSADEYHLMVLDPRHKVGDSPHTQLCKRLIKRIKASGGVL